MVGSRVESINTGVIGGIVHISSIRGGSCFASVGVCCVGVVGVGTVGIAVGLWGLLLVSAGQCSRM